MVLRCILEYCEAIGYRHNKLQTLTFFLLTGDATTECDLDESYCSLFGLDFVCYQDYGRLHNCFGKGRNVLCDSLQKTLWAPTNAKKLKVITYNVWELRYILYQKGQHERTCRIPGKIVDNYGDVDVIVFNEAFMGGCFPEIQYPVELPLPVPVPLPTISGRHCSFRDMLTQYGFKYFTNTVGVNTRNFPRKTENGGVFLASRWPILTEAEIIFKSTLYPSPNLLSAKGVIYAEIEKNVNGTSQKYHIFGTNLQSKYAEGDDSESTRILQAKEMQIFVEEQNIPPEEPVIYAGSLNTPFDDSSGYWDQMVAVLEAAAPVNVGTINVTLDYKNNDVIKEDERKSDGKWIDYVLYSEQ